MKRFFCNVCKRVKRVRNLPLTISDISSTNPYDREGECDYHTLGRTRAVVKPRVVKFNPPVQSAKSNKRKAS